MNRITLLLISTIAIAGCSQLTTNSKELAALEGVADAAGESYVGCVKADGLSNAGQGAVDVATAVQLAVKSCQTEQAAFRQAQEEFLGARMMMTKKPVEESVVALNERASNEIAEELLARGAVASAPQTVAPASAAIAGVAAGSSAASTVAPPADGWSAEQRIYLDCVADESGDFCDTKPVFRVPPAGCPAGQRQVVIDVCEPTVSPTASPIAARLNP